MAATRILRGDGYTTSTHVNQLDWSHEVFYFRLLLMADPKGLFHADPALLRSNLFPLRTEEVSLDQIERMKAAAIAAGLIREYEAAGKRYLFIERYGQRLRAKARFPLPPWIGDNPRRVAAGGGDLSHESEAEFELESELELESEAEAESKSDEPPPPAAAPSPDPVAQIQPWLQQFAQTVTGRPWPPPDRSICGRVIKACKGARLFAAEAPEDPTTLYAFLTAEMQRSRRMDSYALIVRMVSDWRQG